MLRLIPSLPDFMLNFYQWDGPRTGLSRSASCFSFPFSSFLLLFSSLPFPWALGFSSFYSSSSLSRVPSNLISFLSPLLPILVCIPLFPPSCLPAHLPSYHPTHLIYLHDNPPTYPPTHLSTYPPIHLSTYPPIHLSTYPPIHLSTRPHELSLLVSIPGTAQSARPPSPTASLSSSPPAPPWTWSKGRPLRGRIRVPGRGRPEAPSWLPLAVWGWLVGGLVGGLVGWWVGWLIGWWVGGWCSPLFFVILGAHYLACLRGISRGQAVTSSLWGKWSTHVMKVVFLWIPYLILASCSSLPRLSGACGCMANG